jgi:hypothetical protein
VNEEFRFGVLLGVFLKQFVSLLAMPSSSLAISLDKSWYSISKDGVYFLPYFLSALDLD